MKPEKVAEYITQWLDDYLFKSTLKGFVIGVSGGIDSAVASTLTAQTGKPLLCLEMPIHQKADQVTRSKNHIKWLTRKFSNVTAMSIDLTAVFDTFASIDQDKPTPFHSLALANTRARLRMTTLYYYAALKHSLVVGTGNKVEDFGVGFYTKYGDGGVDISPIADLMKSEVFSIAETLGIIEEIQKARPTDGLWDDDRSDEEQIGASYKELEWGMSVHKNYEKDDFQGRQKEVFKLYQRLNLAAQHKIKPIPVCKIPNVLKF